MQPYGLRKKSTIRIGFYGLIILAVLLSPFLQNASARGAQRPPAQAATTTNGYWKFVDATPFDKFTSPGPGSTWAPTFGDSYNGGTVVNATDSGPADRVTTQCSWLLSGDPKLLRPGQTVDVTLTVNSTQTGLRSNVTSTGQDSLTFIDFTGNSASANDDYGINGLTTGTGQGTGSASFVVQPGWTGAAKPATRMLQFECIVASLGIVNTTWNYVWVSGAASDVTPTPDETPEVNFVPAPGAGVKLSNLLIAAGVAGAIILAILAAAGLLVLVLVLTGRNKGGTPASKPSGPKPPLPDPPKIRYALRVSTNSVDVYLGQPASVTFNAWRILPGGESVPAIEAEIQVRIPESTAGLVASPPSGMCSLETVFSVPNPQLCTSLHVSAAALVGGKVMAQANVQVCILPIYGLELKWEDPQQSALQVDGKEVRAWASVTATPPDPDATPDILAGRIIASVQGPNSDWIRQPLNPWIEYEKQWNALAALRPGDLAELQPGNPALVAEFSSGQQRLIARLSMELNQKLGLGAWINGKKEAQSAYQRDQVPPGWDLQDILTYFHSLDNEEKPIKPPPNYRFDKVPFEATPAILDLVDFYENGEIPGQYVLKVALKPDTDLDAAFGDTPEDKRQLKVKVFARDENGQELHDFVSYTFRPMVSFVVHAYEDDPAVAVRQHAYRSLQFEDGKSLVANGDDSLKMAGYFMRTDLLAKSGPDPAKRLNVGDLQKIAWKLAEDGNYFELSDPEFKDAFVLFNVKSSAPIPATIVKDPQVPVTLVARPELNQDEGAMYALESDQVEVNIAVQYPRLHLWVVPGLYRHTSTAIAYLDLLPSKLPLPKQDLCLSMENPDGMMLDFDDCAAHQETIDKDMEKAERRGGAFWKLRYSGITWDNMPQAKFKVRAGLEDPPDESWTAWVEINVYQNLCELLSLMTSDAAFSARVNNPKRDFILPPTMEELEEIKNNSSLDSPNIPIDAKLKAQIETMDHYAKVLDGKASTIVKSGLPRYLRGPLYNIASWFERYSFGEDFVCNSMRNKICVWLEQQRFLTNAETPRGEVLTRLEKMNGLDFGYYSRTPFHVWAGIFPAGADRFSEYRALDPWWYQYWPKEWAQPENLWTQASEDMRLNIFTVLNWLLKLAVISLFNVEQAGQVYQVVNAWLNGTSTDDIENNVIPNSGFQAWWRYTKFDSDNAGLDGRYATGRDPEIWSKDLFKNLDSD